MTTSLTDIVLATQPERVADDAELLALATDVRVAIRGFHSLEALRDEAASFLEVLQGKCSTARNEAHDAWSRLEAAMHDKETGHQGATNAS